MSERFQKTFISVREFVESWDKELYELNNLDFFIYLMINHLGNQLEKRFFIKDKKHTPIYLDFENIGTVCFNIGDAFEYFLEDNCLGFCPVNCPRDLDGTLDVHNSNIEENVKKKLLLLQSFVTGPLDKEQCLRIDLMNHVILDTLINFYGEEFQLDLNEDDMVLLELAEFIEDVIIEFVRTEGQTLLHRPFESALDYFEDLLQSEADEQSDDVWYEDKNTWEENRETEDWQKDTEPVESVFFRFVSDRYYNPGDSNGALVYDISFFKRYLIEQAQLKTIRELDEDHLAEFFSIWMVREFIMSESKQISHIFRATARFITFLFHRYNINLKKVFLYYYDRLKLDLPRVVDATNHFISDCDILEVFLPSDQTDNEQKAGFFEIIDIHHRPSRLMEVRNIHLLEHFGPVKLNSAAFSKLKKGDILHANMLKRSNGWEIFDLQYIYPNVAKRYIIEKC